MKIIKVKNYEEMSQKAFEELSKVIKNNPMANLGLATGSSPIGMYKKLIKDHKENKTSYKNIKTFNLDEYIGIRSNHTQSYNYFMNENLFNHIDIDQKNINIPKGDIDDPNKECEEYNKKLDNVSIDIQILGIGSNGHIGFNEPGTPFSQETHIIELDEKTRLDNKRFFNSLDEVPNYAITMGIKNIMDSKKILLLASGKSKAQAVKKMIEGNVTTDLPASILQKHNNVTIIVDKEAGSLI